ncbi:uncharacterized protein BDZ99DRAFT_473925 [Mytilinidion resinicola]|uniref:Uncharacterized protein n=1 Tax=Mytilinidion resinicola TaxID=574789 RepID=A0A6A6YZ05_9PEZI|nr:uncharacterized protein BDZ99DRAFT_473925 [Mytilinidion resinicola]KAF2813234.1 hypothetical protein BDZ99DRAFT_473925 [Mytilinidion resinicola]
MPELCRKLWCNCAAEPKLSQAWAELSHTGIGSREQWGLETLALSRPPGYIEPEDDWYLKLCLSIGEYGGDYYNSISTSFVAPGELRGQGRFKYSSGSKHLSVYAAKDNPASRYIKKRPFNTSPDSEETFRLARGWMAECQNPHGACPGFQPLQMPSRVLDVGTEQLPETLKVVETSGLQVAPYMALSYCSGPVPGLTALARNIQRLEPNVEYKDLPRTL